MTRPISTQKGTGRRARITGLDGLALMIALTAIAGGPMIPAMGAPDASTTRLVAGNTGFALDLYDRQKDRAGNVFFSPYSISMALAMTYTGARGDTAREMANVLKFGLPPEELPAVFVGLSRRMDEISRGGQVGFDIANSVWCQKDYPFTPEFLKLNRDFYGAGTRQVDFATNPDAVRMEINAWIAQKTRDKIKELLQPGNVSGMTRMVLCNAVYFKGKWVTQFEPRNTQPAPFFTAPGQSIQVPMMSQQLKLRSGSLGDADILALPYVGNDISMVILLPKAMDGLTALENRLDSSTFEKDLAALDAAPEAKAEVFLPKFKMDCRLELARDLAAMGMPSAFSRKADFSGIDGRRDLLISDVVHQAVVEVNEEGTEAAAATAVGIRSMAIARPIIPVFRMDHPFLFLLRENKTGSVLFLGRVANPSK